LGIREKRNYKVIDKLAMNKQKENGVNLCRATEVPLLALTGGKITIGVFMKPLPHGRRFRLLFT